jgi:serine/threonine protein kinase
VPVIEKDQLVAGRYRLLSFVGSGGMGVVWQARDERLERTVAIKRLLIRPGLPDSTADETRRRAMREARIAARLQHPNAIALFDVAEHDGDPCLVMEFLAARSLSAILDERGPLPPDEVAQIGAQVAAALAAAHAAGIAHRDVKPANILMDDSGAVKITDFGISRAMDDSTATQTGMLAGTPAYLAPEIARGNEPGAPSDVFSLGSTLYHAVEGAPPFGTNGNPLALLHAVASGEVPPPQRAGTLTPTLMKLLSAEPGERPTAAQAAAALATVPVLPPRLPEQRTVRATAPVVAQASSAAMTTQPVRPAGTGRATPKRIPVIAVIAVAVAAFVLAGIVAANLLKSSSPPAAQQPVPPSSRPASPSPRPTTSSTMPTPVQGTIQYTPAGELVIAYYNGLDNLPAAWEMLSRRVRTEFGDFSAFSQYWAQFKQVSARNARGLTHNGDGSVNVPVDVTYTASDGADRQEHKELRVINENGRLVIDAGGR